MSRHTSADSAPIVSRRRGPGRHRLSAPSGVRCTELPGVREKLTVTTRGSFLRSLLPSVSAGRHTWDFLATAGGRPRSAFAIILSL